MDATSPKYDDFFKQVSEITMGMGMIVDRLGSSQASNIALLNNKHRQLMQETVRGIASVSFEEASRLILLAGVLLNIKRFLEALEAVSFIFEEEEELSEAQRKNVRNAAEIMMKSISLLRTRRDMELDETLSKFKLLKMTMGGPERIRNNPVSIIVHKMAYNGYCIARVARGLV
ncbi:MAG: hypothetical protein ACUVQ0_03595 [Thermoproteota archaeon]